MKLIKIFMLLLLPGWVLGQNYIPEITPRGNQFRLLLVEEGQETFPRNTVDYGLVNSETLQALAYRQIAQKKRIIASLAAQSFIQELNQDANIDSVENYVSLDYASYAVQQWQNAFNGTYEYEVIGASVDLQVTIQGSELRNAANNNLLATVTPNAINWMTVTVQGTGENIQLYDVGGYFAGRNAANQVVTLTPL